MTTSYKPHNRQSNISGIGRSVMILPYLFWQMCAILFGYLLYGLLDFNNPDGLTILPSSVGSLLLFIGVVAVITVFLTIALDFYRAFSNKDWMLWGAFLIVSMLFAIIWYRAIWLPSPYITARYSDHFTYLYQTSALISDSKEIIMPSVSSMTMNSFGESLFMAFLFTWFEESTFFVIASHVILLSWATLCLGRLFAAYQKENGFTSYHSGSRLIGIFMILPTSIAVVGVITKDSLILFGIALSISSFYQIMAKFSFGSFLFLSIGFSIVTVGRVEFGISLLVVFLLTVLLRRFKLSEHVVGFIVVVLSVWILTELLSREMLALVPSVESLSQKLLRATVEDPLARYEGSSALFYRITRIFGNSTIARVLTLPFSGFISWFIPFPFFIFDYRAILHTMNGIINIISLAITLSCIQIMYLIVRKIWSKRASITEILMLSTVVIFFTANAASPIPMPRYRFPFDWAIMFFWAIQPNPGKRFRRGFKIAVFLALIAHVLYYALGGGLST